MTYSFEQKLEKVLKESGGKLESFVKKDNNPFKWLNNSTNLKEFREWFTEYVDEDNCLTADELKEYEMLKAEGLILTGKDLDKELSEFYEAPPDTLIPFHEVYLESAQLENEAILDRKKIMKKLQEKLLEDEQETDEKIFNTNSSLKAVKESMEYNIQNAFASIKRHGKQLDTVEKLIIELQDYLKQLQGKNFFEMDLDKFEMQNQIFFEEIISFIRKYLDEPSQNTHLGNGDWIPYNGITINFEMELRRLSKGLLSEKQDKFIAEIDVMKVNKAIADIKKLQDELEARRWQPDLSKMRMDTLQNANELEDLENDVARKRKVLESKCHEWSESLIQKVVNDFVKAKVTRMEYTMMNLDNLLDIVMTLEAHSLYIRILMEQEHERIIASANFISELWSIFTRNITELKEQKVLIDGNHNDYLEHMKKPEFDHCGIIKILASLLKTKVADLSTVFEKLQNNIKRDESDLLKQQVDELMVLNKMKMNLVPLKFVMFSGPVKQACVVDYNFYMELHKLEARILEITFNLRCSKMEFIKIKKKINEDPNKRKLQLSWVKFLLLAGQHLEQTNQLEITTTAILPELPEADTK